LRSLDASHLPIWHQLINPIDRMTLCDPFENVAEIGFRVEAVELRRLHDRVDRCGALTAGVGTSEEVVLASERDAADSILGDGPTSRDWPGAALRGIPRSYSSWTSELNAVPDGSLPTRRQTSSPIALIAIISVKSFDML